MTISPEPLKIVGILNITPDSFSDGHRYLDTEAAIQKGLSLIAEGADMVDIGAESSNPDGAKVSAEEEIGRLAPVIKTLKKHGVRISIDTYKPEVMEQVISLGVDMINDITGLRDPAAIEAVRKANIPVVIMFARNLDPHAERAQRDHQTVLAEIIDFFRQRLEVLHQAGIAADKIIIDPGMGLFLGGNPEPSLMVLRHIELLKEFGHPIYLSTSRKSFIGRVLDRSVQERGIGTLATEIWGYLHGVSYIRTHEPQPLRDAIRMIRAIEQVE
ncbi:MAG: dihydropteroate synthase [Dehalococcoidia bacterium]|nr:dihydropteroate synthase [Dehalococcoidia bacterium]